jgi:predicted NAD/FAD-binding protein
MSCEVPESFEMASANKERFQDALVRTHWDEAAALLQLFSPDDAAAILHALSFEQQQRLFRRIPLDTAAILLPRFLVAIIYRFEPVSSPPR